MRSILSKLFLFFTTLILILTIIGSITVIIFLNSNTSIFIMEHSKPIYIYDNDDNLVCTDSSFYEYASITELNANIINAVIATEDKNFYKHNGISVPRIINSIYQNIKHKDIVSGASTITQQYIKNTVLTSEQTLTRKVKEIFLALQLEKKYTKDQILEAYLNNVLFGGNVYGIKMAARYYFDKETNQLTINEAATLAGMIQLPNYFNTFKH